MFNLTLLWTKHNVCVHVYMHACLCVCVCLSVPDSSSFATSGQDQSQTSIKFNLYYSAGACQQLWRAQSGELVNQPASRQSGRQPASQGQSVWGSGGGGEGLPVQLCSWQSGRSACSLSRPWHIKGTGPIASPPFLLLLPPAHPSL